MPIVTITDIAEGATANAASLNPTVASWNSGDVVDATNIRDEGVDRRLIQYPEVTPAQDAGPPVGYYRMRMAHNGNLYQQADNPASTYLYKDTIDRVSRDGYPLIWPLAGGDTYALGPLIPQQSSRSDEVEVSFSGELVWTHNGNNAIGAYVTLCISYKAATGSTGFSILSNSTRRRFGMSQRFHIGTGSGTTKYVPMVRSFTIRSRVQLSADFTADGIGNPLYIGVEAWKSAAVGSFSIRRATLEARTRIV